jgi:hypothetical protein
VKELAVRTLEVITRGELGLIASLHDSNAVSPTDRTRLTYLAEKLNTSLGRVVDGAPLVSQ